jgi:hypothetical protein
MAITSIFLELLETAVDSYGRRLSLSRRKHGSIPVGRANKIKDLVKQTGAMFNLCSISMVPDE